MAELMWRGKEDAITESQKTYAPNSKFEIINDAESENKFYIGDNLPILRLLTKDQSGSVDVIYIDPPYNSGGSYGLEDFVYADRWPTDAWLTFLYPRIVLGRRMLKDNGIMMISIDDREVANLRLMCDEIFGISNFVAEIVWEKKCTGAINQRFFLKTHEYVLIYIKDRSKYDEFFSVQMKQEQVDDYVNHDDDPRGPYVLHSIAVTLAKPEGYPNRVYTVTSPYGVEIERHWGVSKERFRELEEDNRIVWSNRGKGLPQIKAFFNERTMENAKGEMVGMRRPLSIIAGAETHNRHARKEWIDLGLVAKPKYVRHDLYFDYPKPTPFIKYLLNMINRPNAYIMDFFAGSATTAHAAWELNAADSGKRTWTMIQKDEPIEPEHPAYKAGFKHIHEISMERLKRAVNKIYDENGLFIHTENHDLGWKTYRYSENT